MRQTNASLAMIHTNFQRSLQERHCPSGASQFVTLFIALLLLTCGYLACKFIYSYSFLKGVNQLAIHRRNQLARLLPSVGFVLVMVFVQRIACPDPSYRTSSVAQ